MAQGTQQVTSDFEQTASEFVAYLADSSKFPDPYPLFRRVREVEPLHWSEVGTWIALGHPEGRAVLRDQSLSRAAAAERFVSRFDLQSESGLDALETYLAWFINMDGDKHAEVRSLVSQAFSPKVVALWEGVITDAVDYLVKSLEGVDEFDFLHDFAYNLPSRVICEMVGVPFEDHRLFEDWTTRFINTNVTDPRTKLGETTIAPFRDFVAYLRGMVSERRRSSERHEDLVTLFLEAEENGVRLNEHELIAAVMLLIIAGHETTANLITNGMLALMRHPDQFNLLRDNPDLTASAVEEFLRYDGPARGQPRVAVADIPVGDKVIRAGDSIQVLLAATNHDPRAFANPDELDITRESNQHLGFGHGAHFCIGLHIARLEARHAFSAITQRMGALELAAEPQWRNSHVRGVTALQLRRV